MTQIERINTDKISGDQPDQLNQRSIPEHWSWVKLGDISAKITKGSTPTSYKFQYQSSGVKFIRTENIDSEGKVFGITKFINDEANNFLKRSQLKEKDILFSIAGTIGRVGVVSKNDIPANTNQALAIIRLINSNVLHPFIYYYLTSPIVQSIAQKRIAGVGRANISLIDVSAFQIPLPPLAEQKKIVEKIEELFSGLDSGVASLKKAKEQIKLYRQSVLAAAFSGRLHQDSTDSRIDKIKEKKSAKSKNPVNSNPDNQNPENPLIPANPGSDNLPVGWKWVKLGEVSLKIGDVDHKMPKSVENGKYPYLSTKDLTDDFKINFDNAKRISENDFHQLSKKIKPERGDIIFSRYGTIGRNVLVETDIDFLVSYSCAIIKPDSKMITSKYLYLYTLSPLIKSEIKKYTVQTTQANVGISSINNFIVPLPSKEIQQQIVLEIEKRFSEADNLEKAIDDSLAKSELLRQSILSQAFSGKLV
ncbi:MAG: restriction endonuclease subunit S [Ignavibacteriota bacterium]|nr:restriction endonuclease subunit S [Ignavibacteriota bacterium]MCZ2267633.1 restriction endonuclease subunit S [Ignavibacteriales bacterium]QKJ99039.1 MAG: restriction endonuclease subunit S [Ignavibacteriota bacterium]